MCAQRIDTIMSVQCHHHSPGGLMLMTSCWSKLFPNPIYGVKNIRKNRGVKGVFFSLFFFYSRQVCVIQLMATRAWDKIQSQIMYVRIRDQGDIKFTVFYYKSLLHHRLLMYILFFFFSIVNLGQFDEYCDCIY